MRQRKGAGRCQNRVAGRHLIWGMPASAYALMYDSALALAGMPQIRCMRALEQGNRHASEQRPTRASAWYPSQRALKDTSRFQYCLQLLIAMPLKGSVCQQHRTLHQQLVGWSDQLRASCSCSWRAGLTDRQQCAR